MKNEMMIKFEQDMHDNIENMIGEFGLDKVHVASTEKSYVWSKVDKSDKRFEGITIYPVKLYDEVLGHIESIRAEDDADTIQSILDLFTYTITPNMLMTRTNHQIMDEVRTMLEAYDASIVRYAYDSKGVFKQSLKFDYENDTYILQHDDLEPIIANCDFQCIDNIRYKFDINRGTSKCRWSMAVEFKEHPTEPIPILDMIFIITNNTFLEEDADLLETMNNIIEWLMEFDDEHMVRWDDNIKDFVVINPDGEEKTYLGL